MSEPVVATEFISAPLSWKKMANSLCEICGQGLMNWIFVLLKTTTMILIAGLFIVRIAGGLGMSHSQRKRSIG